jgi:teichuronic acid exporter
MSLTQKSLSAVLWSAVDIFLRQGLSFTVSVALARLLSPEQFGTIGLLYLFTGIAGVFVDSGFSAALIQRQDITHADESSVFWFNLGMGLLVAVLLWTLAPLIARFYNLPVLTPLTAVLALNVFLIALGSIHCALLSKRLDFKTQMKIGAIATVLSGAVAIVLAAKGFGVWALAAQTLVATGTTTLLLWKFTRWRPALVFDLESARRLFGFGGYIFAAGLLHVMYSQLYSLLIGKIYGVRDLGFYDRADSTKQLPVEALTGVLTSVAFPIFSAAADDKVKLLRGMHLAIRGIMFVNIPMMLGFAVVAEPLILILFGERWLPAVSIFQILCLGAIFWPLHVINLNVLLAQGHSNLYFRLEIINKVLGCVFLLVGSFFGVIGIAWGQVVFCFFAFVINAHYTQRHLSYGFVAQVRDFIPTLSISLIMAGIIIFIDREIHLFPIRKLIILLLVGSSIFLSLGYAFQLTVLSEIKSLFLIQNLTDRRGRPKSRVGAP